jgi:hypothetical protein
MVSHTNRPNANDARMYIPGNLNMGNGLSKRAFKGALLTCTYCANV